MRGASSARSMNGRGPGPMLEMSRQEETPQGPSAVRHFSHTDAAAPVSAASLRITMNSQARSTAVPDKDLSMSHALTAFRGTKLLTGGYLGISLLTLVAIVLLRGHATVVNEAVWVRGVIVVASALVTFLCAVRAAR